MISSIVKLLPAYRTYCRGRDYPVETQKNILKRLVRRAQSTDFGKQHDFSGLLRLSDPGKEYAQHVPVSNYATMQPWFERVRQGEASVLWPGVVRRFAVSSGTTSRRKITPCTDEYLQNLMQFAALPALVQIKAGRVRGLRRGVRISLTGTLETDSQQPGVEIGEISALVQSHFQKSFLARRFSKANEVPKEILNVSEMDAKLNLLADFAVTEDVRMIGMVPSWGLQFLQLVAEKYQVRTGRRLDHFKRIWPNLQMITGGGVPMSTYRERLQELVGTDVPLLEFYGASEAAIAFQANVDDDSLDLCLNTGTYFEFIPRAKYGHPEAPRLMLSQVEEGVDYVPIVSTCAGLWAYDIGDVIRFTHRYPFRIKMMGRTAEVLCSQGEFVTADEAERALRMASPQCQGIFHVAVRPAGEGRPHAHQWFVEAPATEPHASALSVQQIDHCLQQISETYRTSRGKKGLGAPQLHILAPGTLTRFLMWRDPQVNSQAKVPRVADHRGYADDLEVYLRNCGDAVLARESSIGCE